MADERKTPLVTVRGTAPHDGKVILFERHEDHPPALDKDGNDTGRPHEAFITNTKLKDGSVQTFEVAETAAVKRLIGEGRLEKTSAVSRLTEPAAKTSNGEKRRVE